MPWLFFWIERIMLRSMASVFGVRADAIEAYRGKYPELADRFRSDSDVDGPRFILPGH